MAKANFKLIFIFIVIAIPEILKAQSSSINLSLDSCLKIVLSNNYDLKIAETNLQIYEEKIKEAKKGWMPKVSAFYNGFYDIYQAEHSYNSDDHDDHDHGSMKHFHYDLSNVAGIEANILLYNFNSRKHLKDKSIFDKETANYTKESLKNDIILTLYRLYYTVLINDKLIQIARKNVTMMSDLKDITSKKHEIGVITKFELSQIEQEYNSSKYNLQEKIIALKQSKLELVNFLQLKIDLDSIIFNDDNKQSNIVFSKNLDLDLEQIIKRNPSLLAENFKVKSMEKQINLYKNNLKPTVSGFLSIGTSSQNFLNSESQNNALYTQWGNNITNRIGVSISIPIIHNYRDKSIITQTKMLIENQKTNIEKIENELYGKINSEIITYKNNYKLISIAKEREEISKKVYEMSIAAFNSGTINIYDLNKSRTEYITNQIELSRLEITNKLREKVIQLYYQ